MEKFLKQEIIIPSSTILFSIIIYLILKRVIYRIFSIKRIDERKKNTIISVFTNIIKYIVITFCGLIILDALGVETKAIITSLGVAGLVIGLSFQDILKDFIAGLFIILENQYAVGDHITIGNFRGKVISFGLKTTKILSYTGEIKTIPNRYVDQTVNHSIENPILILDIPVPADYNVEKTKEMLTEVCSKLNSEMSIIKDKIELIGINSITNALTEYRIKVQVLPEKEEEARNEILSNIKIALLKHKEDLMIN